MDRAQAYRRGEADGPEDYSWDRDRYSTTSMHPHLWSQRDTALYIGQKMPNVTWHYSDSKVWLYAQDGSIARIDLSKSPYEVREAGSHSLVDEVEDAYLEWRDAGLPSVADWRIHVDLDGRQRIYHVQPATLTP